MASTLDYLDHLARESARFAEALQGAPSDSPVPTCPEWNADDLLWHLGEVQWFWGTVVRRTMTGSQAEEVKPPRPSGQAALRVFFEGASHDLWQILTQTPPQTPAWTWSPEQTVGFIRRRQAHEALIHRIDAEILSGVRTPMDPALSADGVDEALRIMYGGCPPWGRFTPDETKTIRLRATDTGDSWLVTLGRFTGTDPRDGIARDEADIGIAAIDTSGATTATIDGRAEDLDCWLWHRPTVEPIQRSGDPEVLSVFDSTIGPGIN